MQIEWCDEYGHWHLYLDQDRNTHEISDRDEANRIAQQLVARGPAIRADVRFGGSILEQWELSRATGEAINRCDGQQKESQRP